MIIQCPSCHAKYALDAALQDDAGRDLVWALAQMEPALARAVTSYMGLFRSKSRALGWERSARLAHEVLALCDDRDKLLIALNETTEAIWAKRERETPHPMANHNYLKRVLESVNLRKPDAPRPKAPVEDTPEAPLMEPAATPEKLDPRAASLVGMVGRKAGK